MPVMPEMGAITPFRNGAAMSDATTTETVTESTEATAEAEATESEQTPDLAAEVEKWKALSRKNEATAKANADKAKRFDEFENANKSELEKAQAELARITAERDAATAAALKASIASTRDVPAELLHGDTEDELNASADAALAWLNKQNKAAAPAGKQGLDGKSADRPVQLTREQLSQLSPEERVAAHEAGQLADLLGAKS